MGMLHCCYCWKMWTFDYLPIDDLFMVVHTWGLRICYCRSPGQECHIKSGNDNDQQVSSLADFYQLSSRSNLQPAEGSVSTWICTSRIVSPSQPTSSKPFCRFWPRKCKLRKPKMRKYQFLLWCSNSYFPTCTSEGKGMLSNFVWCCLACLRNVRKPRAVLPDFASCAPSSFLALWCANMSKFGTVKCIKIIQNVTFFLAFSTNFCPIFIVTYLVTPLRQILHFPLLQNIW